MYLTAVLVMATLVSSLIFDSSCSRTLLPWTIYMPEDDRITVQGYYEMVVRKQPADVQDHLKDHILEEVRVGNTKNDLDKVGNTDIQFSTLVALFGKFVKFYVKKSESTTVTSGRPDAFAILMSSSRQQFSRQTLPSRVTVKNKKDELYNAIITFFEREELKWNSSEVERGTAGNTILVLRDALWYIDGHFSKLAECSCTVPIVFKQFSDYNVPQMSKHRKRANTSLSAQVLQSHSHRLFGSLQAGFWDRTCWKTLKTEVEVLARMLQKYANIISEKRLKMMELHSSPEQVHTIANSMTVQYLAARHTLEQCLQDLSSAVEEAGPDVPVPLENFLPNDRRRRYEYMEHVKTGMDMPTVLVTYSPGGNTGNLHWIWHTTCTDISSALQSCQPILESIKSDIPQFHTRAMRQAAYEKYGLISPSIKKSVLRHMYKDLVGDSSAAATTSQSELDERVCAFFELEEPDLIYDLRQLYSGRASLYDTFWEKAKEFLEEDIGTAVDDCRHSQVVHLAKAISVRDLREQVTDRCPPDTPIPSEEYIRLQFLPRRKNTKTAEYYTGKLEVKRMVQQRQWRKSHEDSHYCACIFRYMREYALMMRDVSVLVCVDDKHRVKVGEPLCPVAAAEHGRQVLVHSGSAFQVADHDFTRFFIIPSVVFEVNIPESIAGSWYDGNVHVLYKDAAFEPSLPTRHAAELVSIVRSKSLTHPVVLLYSDGGPDHRVTYTSVKLALIALFMELNLDYLCAARTAPYHSFRNPAERVMSVLNLGLQSVGLARNAVDDEHIEDAVIKCKSVSDVRKLAETNPAVRSACLDAVEPVKILLNRITARLQLKEKKFTLGTPAASDELDDLWKCLSFIDSEFTLQHGYKVSDKQLTPLIKEFMAHCCRQRHYFFEIKKCGDSSCALCFPLQLPEEEFAKLGNFPDPVMKDDGHYRPFAESLGSDTSEDHRPSLQKKPQKDKTLPFYPSVQHVNNCGLMLMCDECGMWRLVYSKRKLKTDERERLNSALSGLSFSCGSPLQGAPIPEDLMDVVYVKKLRCHDRVETLYYSANFSDIICVYCSNELPPGEHDQDFLPQCEECKEKPKVAKKSKK